MSHTDAEIRCPACGKPWAAHDPGCEAGDRDMPDWARRLQERRRRAALEIDRGRPEWIAFVEKVRQAAQKYMAAGKYPSVGRIHDCIPAVQGRSARIVTALQDLFAAGRLDRQLYEQLGKQEQPPEPGPLGARVHGRAQ